MAHLLPTQQSAPRTWGRFIYSLLPTQRVSTLGPPSPYSIRSLRTWGRFIYSLLPRTVLAHCLRYLPTCQLDHQEPRVGSFHHSCIVKPSLLINQQPLFQQRVTLCFFSFNLCREVFFIIIYIDMEILVLF
jgi:hypothetical protein